MPTTRAGSKWMAGPGPWPLRRRFVFIIATAVVCTLIEYTWYLSPSRDANRDSFYYSISDEGPFAAVKGWIIKGIYGQSEVEAVHESAERFLKAYDDFTNSTDRSIYCTPSLNEIEVRINDEEANTVESIDVSQPLQLDITSFCGAAKPGVGDFYETLVSNKHFRARITLENHFDGIHAGIPLQLPLELVDIGEPLQIRVWRLYREFEGIEVKEEIKGNFTDGGPYAREEVLDVTLAVTGTRGRSADDRRYCEEEDFRKLDWSGGYWLRTALEDRSWRYYLPHCQTWQFSQEDASECLGGRWLVTLGDSTSEDMMRNIFWTFLGKSYPSGNTGLPMHIPRQGDFNITHPDHPDRWTRISHLFNGHYRLELNRLGMASFRNAIQTSRHDIFFEGLAGADTFLINSGLHDSWLRETPRSFVDDFDFGWRYYMRKIKEIEEKGEQERPTQLVYRWSNTPPIHLTNYPLVMPMNPSSIEMVNLLERDYLTKWETEPDAWRLSYLDSFDITWPWHFDAEMNSGSHYGRAPWAGSAKKIVDDQLVQYFLTDICPAWAKKGNLERDLRHGK